MRAQQHSRNLSSPPGGGKGAQQRRAGLGSSWVVGLFMIAVALAAGMSLRNRRPPPTATRPAPTAVSPSPSNTTPRLSPPQTNAWPVWEINQAIMVTVELDFGPHPPTIAEALDQIERRSQPDDGRGRTFAILDAYGGPTPQGKLHVSMHVSTEKPGTGALVFRRTGEVLWQSRIIAGTNAAAFTGQNLLILLDDGTGKTYTVDGSGNPRSILEAGIKEKKISVAEFWPDGAEREVTYLYSACGCPVKVKAKRLLDRTVRTGDLPVIFPDDPAVAQLIRVLMRW